MDDSEFDHLKLLEHGDPFPVLAEARHACPVLKSEAHDGFWSLLTYAEVSAAARNTDLFCSSQGVTIPPHIPFPLLPPIEIDPPQHMQYRGPLLERFSAAGVAKHEPMVRTVTRELIAAFVETGSADLATQLTVPLPVITTSELLLIPDEDREKFRTWTTQVILHPDDLGTLAQAMAYFVEFYDRRKAEPSDDIASLILTIEIDGRPIDQVEFVCMMNMLAMAGLDTTASAGANMLELLALRPNQRRELVEHPDRIGRAVEELLRHVSPLPFLSRTTTQPVTIGGVEIPADARVQLNWLAANHDPEEFPDPEALRFDRTPNRHVAFGAGAHRCLGAHLARLELRVMLEELLSAIPNFEIVSPGAARYGGGITRGISSLPVRFPPGGGRQS